MTTLIYGDRLRQARVLRKIKSTDLAATARTTGSTLTRWEQADTVTVESRTLDDIGEALEFPVTFFQQPPSPPVDERDLRFRAPKSTLKREKEHLIQFARMAEEVLRWVDQKQQLPPVTLPRLTPDHDVVDATRQTRTALGVAADKPIPLLTLAVERTGVPVIRRPTRVDADPATNIEKHLGYTAWAGEFWQRPIIITRGVSSWERTRWTIAHEVGHTVLHRSAVVAERESAETAANSFANELLAPIDAVRPELPKMITLLALTDAKARWGLSIGALIKHLHTSRVIDDRRKDTLQAQLYTRHNPETGTTFGKYEPGWKDRTPELPGMLRYWLERTVRTSQPKAVAALMGMWPADLLGQLLDEQALPGGQPAVPPSSPATSGDPRVVSLRAHRNARMHLRSDGMEA